VTSNERLSQLHSLFLVLPAFIGFSMAQTQNNRLTLMPDQGKMHCNVIVRKGSHRDIFALTIPETIGCREGMILNFPSTTIQWEGSGQDGVVSTSWTTDGVVSYDLTLTPGIDVVDAEMTIRNLSDEVWHDVWSFNCLNPVRAPSFQDSLMERPYMSTPDGPLLLSQTKRVSGPRPTVGVYFSTSMEHPEKYPFVVDFQATSPQRSDGNYLVTLSESRNAYMAATSPEALFLFNNQKFKCIHSAPNFGVVAPGESATVTCRFYFGVGNLTTFLERLNAE
jgi:hypothetical protein